MIKKKMTGENSLLTVHGYSDIGMSDTHIFHRGTGLGVCRRMVGAFARHLRERLVFGTEKIKSLFSGMYAIPLDAK